MGSRVRVPSRPQLKSLNPCNLIDCRGFLISRGRIRRRILKLESFFDDLLIQYNSLYKLPSLYLLIYTNYNYNTHNHLLLKGDIVGDINSHLKSKSLIGDHIKHLPYEKSASMHVSKFICDEKTNYGFVKK